MIFEMYDEDGIKIDPMNAISKTVTVLKTNSKINGIKSRSVIQFHKSIIHNDLDDLNIDINLRDKTNLQTDIYVVVYGVSGLQNDVDPFIWDKIYYVENKIFHIKAPIDMGNHFITNIKDPNPSDSNYAATVNFVNKTIDDKLKYSIQSADKSNAFQYVMDNPAGQFYDEDDIKGIKKTVKDFHKINKETYEMQLLLDSRGYYSSRLGVNMYILPHGEYSLVYELYYPNSIDSSTVQISAISAVETVSKVTTNVFNNHTRSIIHLHKYNNVAPNRLMIDMVLKNKAGISYANELTIFVIVYGVSGYVNNVHTSVWDRLFEVTNNGIKFEAAIDMNNNDIKNVHSLSLDNLFINKLIDMNNSQIKDLRDGVENTDAVNVKQINEMETNIGKYIKAEITKADTSLKKYFNDQLNNTIAERGYQNSLICVFDLDNNQFNNGDKITNLPDKKSFMPIHDANQSVESRKPTADDDLNFSYMNYRAQQCLIVNYNLNGKNNLNLFFSQVSERAGFLNPRI